MATSRRTRIKPGSKSGKKPSAGGGGLGNVDQILDRQAQKRAAGRTGFVRVSDDDEDPTILRVFDPTMFREGFIHQVEYEVEDRKRKGKTRTWRQDQMCLDQDEDGTPCPECKADAERRYKFWLPVIWRDAPTEVDGKVKGYADRVAILSGGTRLAQAINRVEKKKGLKNQDVEVVKQGESFNTQYAVDPLDREPLSDEDKELLDALDMKKLKEKLDRYTEMRDFDDYYRSPDERDDKGDDDDDDEDEKPRRSASAFPSRRKSGSSRSRRDRDDDDDDDDDRPRQRRSSRAQAGKKKPGGLANLNNSKKSSGEGGSGRPRMRRRSR